MAPSTKMDFIQACLRKLGHPVVDINLDDDQIDDCVGDALHYFQERHYSGMERTYIKHQITQQNIDESSIFLPHNVLHVIEVFKPGLGKKSGGNFMNDIWQMNYNYSYNLAFGGSGAKCGFMTSYMLQQNHLAEINFLLNGPSSRRFHFNEQNERLLLDLNWSTTFSEGDWLVMEVYMALDPNEWPKVWGSRWLKKYATALMGIQWGTNLSKFEGIQLPGGITLDGDKIYQRYKDELDAIKEDYSLEHEYPVDFIVG